MKNINSPLLSFCIPTYNRSDYLKETLKSILLSVGRLSNKIKYEIVVSDNASTDNTKLFVNKFPQESCINYYRRDITTHPTDNLHYVCGKATGEYIWLLGDDDPMVENAVGNVVEALKSKYIDYLFIPRELVTQDLSSHPCGIQPKISFSNPFFYTSGQELFDDPNAEFFSLVGFYGCNLIRRSLWEQSIEKLGCYHEDLGTDVWWHVKIILYSIVNRPVGKLDYPGVRCRLNPSIVHSDSHNWIDKTIILLKMLKEWGYTEEFVNKEIRFVFHSNTYMFINNKINHTRNGNLFILAKNLQCDKIINKNNIWIYLSCLHPGILKIVVLVRKIFLKISKKFK